MKRNLFLDEKKEEIILLYKSGKTQQEIANTFNVSQGSIGKRLVSWEENNSDGNRYIRTTIEKDTLYDLYWNKQMHPSEIAKLYKCCQQVITNNLIKYNIKRRTKSEARKGKLNPRFGNSHSEETRIKMSEAFKNGRKIGYNTYWGKGAYYETTNQGRVWMRSGWEVKVANYLTSLGFSWYYEPEWLDIGANKHYLPDFFVEEWNCYIEVKGRYRQVDLDKFELAKIKYNILFWDSKELLKLGIIQNSGNTELNRKYRRK
jgi:hypothetical protein